MISDVHDLPEKFALHLTRGSEPGRQCRVIWQRNHDVGVEFLKTPPEHKVLWRHRSGLRFSSMCKTKI